MLFNICLFYFINYFPQGGEAELDDPQQLDLPERAVGQGGCALPGAWVVDRDTDTPSKTDSLGFLGLLFLFA